MLFKLDLYNSEIFKMNNIYKYGFLLILKQFKSFYLLFKLILLHFRAFFIPVKNYNY